MLLLPLSASSLCNHRQLLSVKTPISHLARASFLHQQLREPQQFGFLAHNPFRSLAMSKKRRVLGAVCSSTLLTPKNLQWVATVCSAGEYGIWTAFLALLVRLFFYIPGELELPFMTLLLVIASPYQIMRLRGTQEGIAFSLAIAIYLAFQHFTRAGSLGKAFDQGAPKMFFSIN